MRTGPCFFCGKPGAWCPVCKTFLCADHAKDWARRGAQAAAHPIDTGKKILEHLAGR